MTIKHRYGSGVGLISDRAAGAAARNGLAHDFTPACTVFVGGSRKTLHQSIIGRHWPKADEALLLTAITDYLAHRIDVAVQGGIGNDATAPHGCDQVIFANHTVAI